VHEVSEIQWYFPNKLEEVPDILSREGVIPHGGGTGILWGGLTRVRGLMDIGGLDLKFLRFQDGSMDLGAALSYSEAAEALAKSNHLLSKSLSAAATEPLRHRICLGGSISMFPYWSDLMGPLLAFGAELSLVGAISGTWPLVEYLRNRGLRKSTLITSVRLPNLQWQGAYYRHTRTLTDRPAFSITVLLRQTAGRIKAIRIVVVGCSGRYRRLAEVEKILEGAEVASDTTGVLEAAGAKAAELDLGFPARMGFTSEYLKDCASIELGRTLHSALQSALGEVPGPASGIST
jgi:CO/xanthine dehydrogenase FAD-binding subunit